MVTGFMRVRAVTNAAPQGCLQGKHNIGDAFSDYQLLTYQQDIPGMHPAAHLHGKVSLRL